MRTSQFATNLARRVEMTGPTEDEFITLFPIADRHAKALAVRPPEGSDFLAARDSVIQQGMADLVATFGYDRALDFIWSASIDYTPFEQVAREGNLPRATAGQIMQLAAETGEEAAAIHSNASLSLEQKRTALAALQARVKPTFDRLMPPDVQQQVVPRALEWFTELPNGRYKRMRTTLPGASGVVLTTLQSIESPLSSAPRTQPMPPRPPAP